MKTLEERVKRSMNMLLEGAIDYQNELGKEPPTSFFSCKLKGDGSDKDELMYLNMDKYPKPLAAELVEVTSRIHEPEYAVIVCGAWASITKTREEAEALLDEHGAVRNVPGRKDVLMVTARTMYGREYRCMVEVKDNKASLADAKWTGFTESTPVYANERGGYDRFMDRVVFRKVAG